MCISVVKRNLETEAAEDRRRQAQPDEECDHRWMKIGEASDGTAFFRCIKCKRESE